VVAKSAVFYSTLKPPSLFWGWRLLKRDTKRYLLPSLIGVAGYAGYSNMPIFILGSVAAPLQSAVFAAMRSLVQPLLVIIRSLDVVDKNFFSSSGMTRQQMKKSFWKLFMAYGALALGMIAVLGLAATPLVHMVYGEKYAPYAQLLIGWGMIFLMMALTSPIETIVVKTGRINTYNLYRIPAGIAGMVLAVALCPQYGAWGAVWACFAGWVVSVVGALYLIRRNIT
jgi:O-antigen/teichoic acid export membrane protein